MGMMATMGSPPRMREKPLLQRWEITPSGITPAYAGKTNCHIVISPLLKDHPRVCGKNKGDIVSDDAGAGSPPRMREKLYFLKNKSDLTRITPAYAGKTTCRANSTSPLRDHPRVCGKNYLNLHYLAWDMGSPPRMREKH